MRGMDNHDIKILAIWIYCRFASLYPAHSESLMGTRSISGIGSGYNVRISERRPIS